jgi:lysophospholipase L1-like esterase
MIATALLALGLTGSPALAQGQDEPRILVMGDSLMAMHKLTGRAVSATLRRMTGARVTDRAIGGARYFYRLPISGAIGLNIRQQYQPGDWDWVVLSGGGNDLWLGCGCNRCERRMDRMISRDGRRGVIPGLLSRLRHDGARVIYVGYLRTPGVNSPIEHCADEGDEFDRRMARLAALDRGLHFVPLSDMVPHGDLSYHAIDRIHPSVKASREIGARVARIISAEAPPVVSRNRATME